MSLIVLMGPQAVGKMTVGRALEKKIDGKLLFNHQTIDLFANFLGYTPEAFRLSDETRLELFKSFVKGKETNKVKDIIFTVLVDFDSQSDIDFLQSMTDIFQNAEESVYFIALSADLAVRLERNEHEERLLAKPSKRDLDFSKNELITSVTKHRLNTSQEELKQLFPDVQSLLIDNTQLSPEDVANKIHAFLIAH